MSDQVYFRHEVVGWALLLPRSPAPAVGIASPYLCFGVPCAAETYSALLSRHPMGKPFTFASSLCSSSGANAVQRRKASAGNQRCEPISGPRKTGVTKGCPLGGALPTFSPRRK